MSSTQQIKDEALASIDAALAILQKFPDISNVSTDISANVSLNPLDFLLDAFKHTTGYDTLINILSKYIATALPALELSVKAILMTNMKNLISCSINPYISDDLLKDGISFDLKQLDITNMLKTCPLDESVGQYYYFGCDEMSITDEVKNSEDFNCLLWYMKNKAVSREVWGMEEEPDDTTSEKLSKSNGIITLEYTESSLSMKDAVGEAYYPQTPFNNCLHVFIGNAKMLNDKGTDTIINKYSDIISSLNEELEEYNDDLADIENDIDQLMQDYENQTVETDEYEEEYTSLQSQKEAKENEISDKEAEIEEATESKNAELEDYKDSLSNNYRSISRNYYYKKTLIQFNYDYIYSLKLFDEKVVTALMIDSLTGCLSVNLNLSYSQKVIQEETLSIIKQIVETDDATVSDCFFTFSNDDYNSMLEKSESLRNGLLNIEDEEVSNVQVDAESLLSSLNGISSSATKQEVTSVIEGTINELTTELSSSSSTTEGSLSFGVQMNIIEQLLTSLVMSIVTSILSPKVYLLLLVNLKTLGQNTDFTLSDFISQFNTLLTELIRALRDEIISFLVEELTKLLKELAVEIAGKLVSEQAAYYVRLIKQLVDCIKRNGSGSDSSDSDADVTGADIYDTDEEPETTEC